MPRVFFFLVIIYEVEPQYQVLTLRTFLQNTAFQSRSNVGEIWNSECSFIRTMHRTSGLALQWSGLLNIYLEIIYSAFTISWSLSLRPLKKQITGVHLKLLTCEKAKALYSRGKMVSSNEKMVKVQASWWKLYMMIETQDCILKNRNSWRMKK